MQWTFQWMTSLRNIPANHRVKNNLKEDKILAIDILIITFLWRLRAKLIISRHNFYSFNNVADKPVVVIELWQTTIVHAVMSIFEIILGKNKAIIYTGEEIDKPLKINRFLKQRLLRILHMWKLCQLATFYFKEKKQ